MSGAALATVGVFVWLVGLCVGSFLNVVIYRLPRGLSVRRPARSFCPRCEAPIAAADNVPVLGWLLLRGRSRCCQTPISAQYPLVEALTGAIFLLTYFLLFAANARVGVSQPALPTDAPLLLAWLVLVATLIACSAMDLTSYMVDTRVTNFAVAAGVALHALWPRPNFVTEPVSGTAGMATTAVALAALLWLWRTVWTGDDDSADDDETSDATVAPDQAPPDAAARLLAVLATLGLVGWAGWLTVQLALPATGRLAELLLVPVALGLVFLTIVLVGGQARAADEEVAAELEAEAPQARMIALRELGWLTPLVLVGGLALLLGWAAPAPREGWQALVAWSPLEHWRPLAGLAFAAHGAVAATTAGWALRIIFTLAFGREAFGVGDIYILAAAGATAGWDIALLGLLLSVGLALAGWLLGLVLKTTMMIPFGPWLALGFLAALWCNPYAADVAQRYADNIGHAWRQQPALLAMGGGVMLVGGVAAVLLAKFVRRLVEPNDGEHA